MVADSTFELNLREIDEWIKSHKVLPEKIGKDEFSLSFTMIYRKACTVYTLHLTQIYRGDSVLNSSISALYPKVRYYKLSLDSH